MMASVVLTAIMVIIAVLTAHMLCCRSTTYRRGDTSMMLLFTIGQKSWPLVFDTIIIVVVAPTNITITATKKGPLLTITAITTANITIVNIIIKMATLPNNRIMVVKIMIQRMIRHTPQMMIATITSSHSLRCQLSLLQSLLTIEVGHVFFWLVVVVIGGVIAVVGIGVGVTGGRFDNVESRRVIVGHAVDGGAMSYGDHVGVGA
mmetsp:Transcript_20727/g.35364  ORF Transcript_20727/g.35364 Transcript_20727/m.35364 type:complete len:205 (-) Transcript_20727:268-882(-)